VRSDAEYEVLWKRITVEMNIEAFGAFLNGELVAIVHFLSRGSAWSPDVRYLQDLFVQPEVRGQGVARALIECVAAVTRECGSPRLYWLAHHTNSAARALYDKVASHSGFIRYRRAIS
jgi:GNAT superfamily N-acetyltransferase